MKKFSLKRAASVIYAVVIAAMACLFFTNDFGLVDIRKTAVITGAGIDLTDGGVRVTAQLAVPRPSESGEDTQYVEVEGEGASVSEALNVINKKTGFYPKLLFCRLIILGESCKNADIFEILDYFFRDSYTQLTPLVAMCEGSAGELLSSDMRLGNTATISLGRMLSDEAKKSGNVSTVNLKIIGAQSHSPSGACYMPYIRSRQISAEGGSSGDSAGDTSAQSGQTQGAEQGEKKEFLCDTTAVFNGGKFAGVLSAEQTFALNLLKNDVRHVFITCSYGGDVYTLGLRSCSGGVRVAAENGVPAVKISFSAVAQISDVDRAESPESASDGVVPRGVLAAGEGELERMFSELVKAVRGYGCDVLSFNTLLYRFAHSFYGEYAESFFGGAATEYEVCLRSAG